MKFPKVTIVTVCFNEVDNLEITIKSVCSQNYPNIEYLIIDGNSDDGTLDIIEKYREQLSRVIVEEDEGIYFAMNKGLKLASGEWLGFMNAGDIFYSRNSVSQLISVSENSDIVFGRSITRFGNQTHIRHQDFNLCNPDWYKLKTPNHQAILVSRKVFEQEQFNTQFRIFSDSEYLYRIFSYYRWKMTNEIVTEFALGGRSNYYPKWSDFYQIMEETKQLRKGKGLFAHSIKFILQKFMPKRLYFYFYFKFVLKS